MKSLKQNEAIKHITKQMMESKDDTAIVAIEEYLTNICNTDAVAEKLLADDKTIQKAYKKLEDYARGKRKANSTCVYIPPNEAFEIIEKYYGITDEDKAVQKVSEYETKDILSMI